MKIIVIGALAASLVNFRGKLLKAMVAKDHRVFAAANGSDEYTEAQLEAMGVEYCPIRVARAGMNPLADLSTLFDLILLMRHVRPGVVLSYTIKPVIYGGLAARLCGVNAAYSLVTGLGYAFMDPICRRQRLAGWLAKSLYRLSLRYSRRVFFQNPDDRDTFVAMGLVAHGQAEVVNGSGVDLEHFQYSRLPDQALRRDAEGQRSDGPACVRFLLIARLLRSKGLGEFAAAARLIQRKYPHAEFHLVGPFDTNPAGLKPEEVRSWENEGLLQFHGEQADVRPFFRDCHVYVLPSYREGLPRTILEAMAMGRPIITTDAPGCRETVVDGDNGFLVPVRDAPALAQAMEQFILHPELMEQMGRRSRKIAEDRFDVNKINDRILQLMELV